MDIFILGAGRPARGDKPSGLKEVAFGSTILDWQIRACRSAVPDARLHYLGGYHVEEVIAQYPQLNFTVVPNWKNGSILQTFLHGPFRRKPVLVSYADTLFREPAIHEVLAADADIVFGIDSLWTERFEGRSAEDIAAAEIMNRGGPDRSQQVEFTGLVRFSERVVEHLSSLAAPEIGRTLIDLIRYLEANGYSSVPVDVSGRWAELNAPMDLARFVMGTKAETLARLEPVVRCSHIGTQVNTDFATWRFEREGVLSKIRRRFGETRLVVRSSSKNEDGWTASNAGGFTSLLDVDSSDSRAVAEAIDTVFASYGDPPDNEDQVLLQEQLLGVRAAGVVFTCSLETGAPYYRFNFDDKTSSTDSVTSGARAELRTVILSRFEPGHLDNVAPELAPVLAAIQELEQLLKFEKLDVEFAIDSEGRVNIFQIRPIAVDHSEYEVDHAVIRSRLRESARFFRQQQAPSPFVFGERTILANMPDWNPAEIIGTRPKPLAASLYRHLITNEVWATQRAEYGYRDVRPCPLIVSLFGQPYVDARASLNSFIPADLDDESAARIAAAYLQILEDNPAFHDKIEFEVAFTIWTPGFHAQAARRLSPYGVSENDIESLERSLKQLTCRALTRLDSDIASVQELAARRRVIASSGLSPANEIHLLLEDCRRLGTLAFSHAARAGFVATTLLKSLVANGLIEIHRRDAFLQSFDTVMGEFTKDKESCANGTLTRDALVAKFGHLRPGTYDLVAEAYWEDPDRYLHPDVNRPAPHSKQETTFRFSHRELSALQGVLDELESGISPTGLGDYLARAIQARESVKFEFTRNISRALDLGVALGASIGLNREEMAFLEWHDLERLRLGSVDPGSIQDAVTRRRQNHAVTKLIELPPVIAREHDLYCFERHASLPNYVTTGKVQAPVEVLGSDRNVDLNGKIILIPQADPGFDWLFGENIGALITKYGGANSHMAIRASEIGLPAAIGVGEKLYEQIAGMRHLELDCANQTIREIQ